MNIAIGVFIVLLLTGATGYFVAQEFAYVAADRGRLRQQAEAGDSAAARALRVCERLSFTLSGAQLGITVTALLVGYVAEPLIGRGIADALGLAGLGQAASLSIAVVVALVFATGVQMVFGELAPKNWAIAHPETLAKALSRSTLVYLAIAGPVVRVFDTAANRLLRRAGIEPIEELPQGATPEDLERIVAQAQAGGGLDADVSGLLRRGLGFRALIAGQAMTPRIRVHTVDAEQRVAEVVAMMDKGYSRFPVVGRNADEILGVVGAKEVLAVPPHRRSSTPVSEVAVPAVVVPATLPLPKVLEQLRREHRQLACVADEYGGFAGVISLEDIAEELVGQIRDEDDPVEPVPHRRADGSWLLPARMRIDEIGEATGLKMPESDDYDTLSGLILQRIGRMPIVGDLLHIELIESNGSRNHEEPVTSHAVAVVVTAVDRHVPATVSVSPPFSRKGDDPR